ncbi:MAG: hypothetical protein AABW81_03090 [Nanoarchaeota archaeon]
MSKILKELREHAPFTFLATVIAVILVIVIRMIISIDIDLESFQAFHIMHIFISAITSAAIFHKYKKNIFLSILIGVTASIIIGTISDVLIPFLGGNLLFFQTLLYIPIFKEPVMIILPALAGSLIGLIFTKTKISHFGHVFLSVFASLFYLLSFSQEITMLQMIFATLITFIAVLIPCCAGDIIYPLLFVKKK